MGERITIQEYGKYKLVFDKDEERYYLVGTITDTVVWRIGKLSDTDAVYLKSALNQIYTEGKNSIRKQINEILKESD